MLLNLSRQTEPKIYKFDMLIYLVCLLITNCCCFIKKHKRGGGREKGRAKWVRGKRFSSTFLLFSFYSGGKRGCFHYFLSGACIYKRVSLQMGPKHYLQTPKLRIEPYTLSRVPNIWYTPNPGDLVSKNTSDLLLVLSNGMLPPHHYHGIVHCNGYSILGSCGPSASVHVMLAAVAYVMW